jgi:hypothetical protein
MPPTGLRGPVGGPSMTRRGPRADANSTVWICGYPRTNSGDGHRRLYGPEWLSALETGQLDSILLRQLAL